MEASQCSLERETRQEESNSRVGPAACNFPTGAAELLRPPFRLPVPRPWRMQRLWNQTWSGQVEQDGVRREGKLKRELQKRQIIPLSSLRQRQPLILQSPTPLSRNSDGQPISVAAAVDFERLHPASHTSALKVFPCSPSLSFSVVVPNCSSPGPSPGSASAVRSQPAWRQ